MDMSGTPLHPLTGFQKLMVMMANVAMGAGMSINFVVVAPLTRKTGLGEIEVAGILTLSTLVYAVMIPYWGRLADRFGRKRVMVFSLCAMAVMNMAFLFALDAALTGVVTGLSALLLLMFVRLWFGLLSPGLQPASMAAMADATTPATRAAGLGMLGAGMSIGSILGPAGAAVLAPFGALMPIWGSIIFCFAIALLLAVTLPATRKGPRVSLTAKRLAMTDPRVRPHLIFLLVYFVAIGMIQQTLGWFIEDRYQFVDTPARSASEAAVRHTGIAFACLAVTMIAIQFGFIARFKPDPRRILPVGLALVCIGYLAADAFHPFWAMCLSFLVVGAGAALAVPSANALGSLAVTRDEQGAAAALMSAAPPAGFIFGPLLGAVLYAASPQLPMLVAAIVVGTLAAFTFFLVTKAEPTPS